MGSLIHFFLVFGLVAADGDHDESDQSNLDDNNLLEDFSVDHHTINVDPEHVCNKELLPPVEMVRYDGCDSVIHGGQCAYTCLGESEQWYLWTVDTTDMVVNCNCTNDFGIIDTRSVCRWEFAAPPTCAEQVNTDLEQAIQNTEIFLQNETARIEAYLTELFNYHVQGPYDDHKALVEDKIVELNLWLLTEPSERDTADAAINARLDAWMSGVLDDATISWNNLATFAVVETQETHTETEQLVEWAIGNQTEALDTYVTLQVEASQGDMTDKLANLGTELNQTVESTIQNKTEEILTSVDAQWLEITTYQDTQAADMKVRLIELIDSYKDTITESLTFTDADMASLYALVDAEVEDLEATIKGLTDTADTTISAKITTLRGLIQVNADGGLNETQADALIEDITTQLNLMVFNVSDYLQETIDGDYIESANYTNNLVSAIRDDLMKATREWKEELEKENAQERDSNIWISSFYAQDSWDELQGRIMGDVDYFGTECNAAVDKFEAEMLAKMGEISSATDDTVTLSKDIFNETLQNGTAEIEAMIDDMADGVIARIADILAEMEVKLDDQYASLDAAISQADTDIETSLIDGLAMLEAEFNDTDNIAAMEALKALALQDFASLKLDQVYYAPHHHHVHPDGYIHDPLEHAPHEHLPHHASYGPHHIHLNEPHHLYTDDWEGYWGSLDDDLKEDWPQNEWPVWNGTHWNFEETDDDHPWAYYNHHGGHADVTDPYHPHKHEAGFPEHGPHPLNPHSPPHHHHDHGDDTDDPYAHEHQAEHDEEPYHTHINEPHFAGGLASHHGLHNFHPHAHGAAGSHTPDDPIPFDSNFDHHTHGAHGPGKPHAHDGPEPIEGGEDGVFELHRHPPKPRKVLIAKMSFDLETEIEFDRWISDSETNQYDTLAEKYNELFDEEFEGVAEDFKMYMTGFYIKFVNATAHGLEAGLSTENAGRKRRGGDHVHYTDNHDFIYSHEHDWALARIVVYFEKMLPVKAPVYQEWYEKWLAIKLSHHAQSVIATSDGSLTTNAAEPVVTVDTFVKLVTPEPGIEHFGFNPGEHHHYDEHDNHNHGPKGDKHPAMGDPGIYAFYDKNGFLRPNGKRCAKEKEQAELEEHINTYIPQCNAYGGYRPEQCWPKTGFCWCVDAFGERIPGTQRKGWGKCPAHIPMLHGNHDLDWTPHAHTGALEHGHTHGFDHDGEGAMEENLVDLFNNIFAELHKPIDHGFHGPHEDMHDDHHTGAHKPNFDDFFHSDAYGHDDDHHDHHDDHSDGWFADDETQTGLHNHDHHDGVDSHTDTPTQKIVLKAQFSIPLTIDYSLALTNENSARYMLYAIKMAKIFGFGFRQIGGQLHLRFKNMHVEFTETMAVFDEHDHDHDHRRRRSANHAHATISLFYEKPLHRGEELDSDDMMLYKNWIENMVSVSAHRSMHEFGGDLTPDQDPPGVHATCEIKYLVPWEEEMEDDHDHDDHDHDDDEDEDDYDDETTHNDTDTITYIPYSEESKYRKRINAVAVFDVPTRKLFTMELTNKKSPRYMKEAAKLKNIFLSYMLQVEVDMKFDGIGVEFFNIEDHTDDHHGRKRRSVNYAWAEIHVYFKKIVMHDDFVDEDLYITWIESRVHLMARQAIKAASPALVRNSHVPDVHATVDTEMVQIEADHAPGHAHHHDDHDNYQATHSGHDNHYHENDPIFADDNDDNHGHHDGHHKPKPNKHDHKPGHHVHADEYGIDHKKCLKEYERSQKRHMVGQYVPQCDENGRYLPMQCWAGTGYCWCVNLSGERIQGTAKRGPVECKDHFLDALFDNAHFDGQGHLLKPDHAHQDHAPHHAHGQKPQEHYKAEWMEQGYDLHQYWDDKLNSGPKKDTHGVGLRACSRCRYNADCGDWNYYYMECDKGYCVCSKDWIDADRNPFNGCETKAFGVPKMSSAKCMKDDHDKPGYGSDKPGYGSDKPGYGSDKPGYGSDKPGYGSDKPGYGSDKPGYGSDKPGYGSDKPGYGPEKGGSGLGTCSRCRDNGDCGNWDDYYMECRNNFCVCSAHWLDSDGDRTNGCEAKVDGVPEMDPRSCHKDGHGFTSDGYDRPDKDAYGPDKDGYGPNKDGYGPDKDGYGQEKPGYGADKDGYGPSKDTPKGVRTCSRCRDKSDCGNWNHYYLECVATFCVCSRDWVDGDRNPFNGCERKLYGARQGDPQECAKPSIAGYQGAGKPWIAQGMPGQHAYLGDKPYDGTHELPKGHKPSKFDADGNYVEYDMPGYNKPGKHGDMGHGHAHKGPGEKDPGLHGMGHGPSYQGYPWAPEMHDEKPKYGGAYLKPGSGYGVKEYGGPGKGKAPGRWNSDGEWVEFWEETPDRITHGPLAHYPEGHALYNTEEGHHRNAHHHHRELGQEHQHENEHDVTDGYDAIHSQMFHNLISHLHRPGQPHHDDFTEVREGYGDMREPHKATGFIKPHKKKEHYHADDHDADSHGSHNWADLSFGVSSHGPHDHKKGFKDEYDHKYDDHDDHDEKAHGDHHDPVHADKDHAFHHHHERETPKFAVCGRCTEKSDCGEWNKLYMDCERGRCVCSANFADFDGKRENGCEAVSYGARMTASQCPPLPTPKPSIHKCGSCKNNFDCGEWNTYYMECNKGYCVCSKHWADLDGNPFNGCERLQYTSSMSPEECGAVKPDEPTDLIQVIASIEFDVDTSIEYTESLTIERQPAYYAAAQSVGDVFVDELAAAEENWNLAKVSISFFNNSEVTSRRRRDDEEEVTHFAGSTISVSYERKVEVDTDIENSNILDLLNRRVLYRARRAILLSQADVVPKSFIYQGQNFPELNMTDAKSITMDKTDYKPIEKPTLDYLPPPPPPTERPPPPPPGGNGDETGPPPGPDGDKPPPPEGQDGKPPKPEGQQGKPPHPEGGKPQGNYYYPGYNYQTGYGR